MKAKRFGVLPAAVCAQAVLAGIHGVQERQSDGGSAPCKNVRR
jgi:hypothetical protein